MLKSIEGNNMSVICNNCEVENQFDLEGVKSNFLNEFNEYENLSFLCPNCNAIESFNMNIPIDDIDEPFKTGDLPIQEEIQRHYVRILMRIVRDDLR